MATWSLDRQRPTSTAIPSETRWSRRPRASPASSTRPNAPPTSCASGPRPARANGSPRPIAPRPTACRPPSRRPRSCCARRARRPSPRATTPSPRSARSTPRPSACAPTPRPRPSSCARRPSATPSSSARARAATPSSSAPAFASRASSCARARASSSSTRSARLAPRPSRSSPSAHAEAERIVAEAREQASRLLAEGRAQAERTVASGGEDLEKLRADAAEQAQRVRAKAREDAREIVGESHVVAREVLREGTELSRNLRELSVSLRNNAERLLRDVRLAHGGMTARLDQAGPAAAASTPVFAGRAAATILTTISTCRSSFRRSELARRQCTTASSQARRTVGVCWSLRREGCRRGGGSRRCSDSPQARSPAPTSSDGKPLRPETSTLMGVPVSTARIGHPGAIAQLGERRHGMAEVVGSSPTSSIPASPRDATAPVDRT